MSMRGIPPITSTGSNRRRPTRSDGLAHMSLGRYMSEKRRSEEEDDSWDIKKHSKSEFNKRTGKRDVIPIIKKEEQITSITDIFYDYNNEGDLAIIIEFKGFEFLGSTFDRAAGNPEPLGYHIPVSYKELMSSLYLTSTGGIFEYKICKTSEDCLFGKTLNIPELIHKYDSETMTPTLKNNWVIITYKRKMKETDRF